LPLEQLDDALRPTMLATDVVAESADCRSRPEHRRSSRRIIRQRGPRPCDAVLAGADAFDDRDVGEAHVLLDSLRKARKLDLCAGPQVATGMPPIGPTTTGHARRPVPPTTLASTTPGHAQALADVKAEAKADE